MKRNLFEQEYEDFGSDLTNALAEHFCAWLVKDISEQNRIELSWANFNLLQDYCHVSDLANAKSHKAVLDFIEDGNDEFELSFSLLLLSSANAVAYILFSAQESSDLTIKTLRQLPTYLAAIRPESDQNEWLGQIIEEQIAIYLAKKPQDRDISPIIAMNMLNYFFAVVSPNELGRYGDQQFDVGSMRND